MPILVTPTKVIKFCENIIENYCDTKTNSIHIKTDELNQDRYILQGGISDIASGSNNQRTAVVLMNCGFWLHFSLTLEKKKQSQGNSYLFKGLSLQIFNESEEVKVLLFRAEWDNGAVNEFNHPQPHWHFHPHVEFFIDGKNIDTETFNQYLELKNEDGFEREILEKAATPKNDLSSFHFAMTANWLFDKNCRAEFTETSLNNWLEACLKSIELQLRYSFS